MAGRDPTFKVNVSRRTKPIRTDGSTSHNALLALMMIDRFYRLHHIVSALSVTGLHEYINRDYEQVPDEHINVGLDELAAAGVIMIKDGVIIPGRELIDSYDGILWDTS